MGRIIRLAMLCAAMSCAAPLATSLVSYAAVAGEHGLELRELALARGIAEREPTGVTDNFNREDARAYAFARVGNDAEPATLFFVWRRGEKVHSVYTSTIGTSKRWRVWSYVSLRPGPWKVELVTQSGKILAERSFHIE